ncbi:Lrp/AsnC family transcriptional regulator [Oscillospiraceae bacterium LTW-04]|nr:Lrp/AsnC family transcriptional regulator [Oscillospiraceae bacterium MB24-C1]
MDRTDIKIMNILQQDCKTTTREIGKQVGLTAPAVSERILRLRESGAIQAFRAKLDVNMIGKKLSAYIMINVPPETYTKFCTFAEENPAIVEHHHIIGVNNALLRIQVADSTELEQQLSEIRKFGMSQTSILLNTYFDQKPLDT